jgi:phosphatidate cytidylyltransferase
LLVTRIITGAVLGVVITVTVLFLPTPAAAAILGLLWLAGAWEWAGLVGLATGGRAFYTAGVAVCMAAGLLWLDTRAALLVLILALLWWLLAFGAVLAFPRQFSRSFVAVAGLVVLLPSWLLLSRLHGGPMLGPGLALTLLLIVWAADIGAYAFGRWLGRVTLAPAVRPGTTWEGVGGGLLSAALVGGLAALVLGLPVGGLVSVGIATALVSVLGDLTTSMFKRNVGVKDSGHLLPGHGGVMDRIDSLTAAVPVFVLGLWLIGLGG